MQMARKNNRTLHTKIPLDGRDEPLEETCFRDEGEADMQIGEGRMRLVFTVEIFMWFIND